MLQRVAASVAAFPCEIVCYKGKQMPFQCISDLPVVEFPLLSAIRKQAGDHILFIQIPKLSAEYLPRQCKIALK